MKFYEERQKLMMVNLEEDAPDVVNAIERDIRVKCLIKNLYLY